MTDPVSQTNNDANRVRIDKTAADWTSRMLFSEPIKVLGAIQAHDTRVAWLLLLVMLAQLLGYGYLAGRVGAHSGYPRIKRLEVARWAAVLIYFAYVFWFAWVFCFFPAASS
jgi:hypothetical protein